MHEEETGLTFHRAPSVRLAATQPITRAEIKAENSAVTGSHGPLSPAGIQAAGIRQVRSQGLP